MREESPALCKIGISIVIAGTRSHDDIHSSMRVTFPHPALTMGAGDLAEVSVIAVTSQLEGAEPGVDVGRRWSHQYPNICFAREPHILVDTEPIRGR